jgi:hypothetical protein
VPRPVRAGRGPCRTTPAPFTRVTAPRPPAPYGIQPIRGPGNDSNAPDTCALTASPITSAGAPPGAPVTTDPVVGLLRASLGALLVRRVAMLGRERLAPASAALAEVRAAARDGDHARLREVDLWFQDALARIADLPQAARTFERLTARLRVFITVLDMDYSQACDTIASEDVAVHDALREADGNEAARLWRVKIERCARYMIARFPEDDVAPQLWTTLAGRPRLARGDARHAAH